MESKSDTDRGSRMRLTEAESKRDRVGEIWRQRYREKWRQW